MVIVRLAEALELIQQGASEAKLVEVAEKK